MKRFVLAAVFLPLLWAGVTADAADRKFEKQFSVSPGGTLSVTTDVGDVSVTGTTSNEVSIVAEIRGSEREINGFEINAWQSDRNVEVKARNKNSGWFSWMNDNPDVRFTIRVPYEYGFTVHTSGGDIEITHLKGKVQGETSGGNLRLTEVEGGVRLETSGGNIRGEKLAGEIAMETSGGNIAIAGVTGSVDVSTSGGDIRLGDVDGKIKAETSGGNMILKLKNENKGVAAETSGGDIDISVPRNINATLDLSTTGGDVQCDLPVTMSGKFNEGRIRGTVNGGGNAIHARTSGGDIRVYAGD
jgi:hypothetical protein